eukprot:2454265-Rhodomonas_salina.1
MTVIPGEYTGISETCAALRNSVGGLRQWSVSCRLKPEFSCPPERPNTRWGILAITHYGGHHTRNFKSLTSSNQKQHENDLKQLGSASCTKL